MSWLEDNILPLAAVVGGGAMTATGVGAGMGIPLMAGGIGMMGVNATNASNRNMANDATNANITSARDQMAFQERMSNSAQTRARQDAINAGYNPMLPAINSNSASSPQGAAGKAETYQAQNVLGAGLTSAIQLKSLVQELDLKENEMALNRALMAKGMADANASTASAKESITRTAALESQLGAIKNKSKYEAAKAEQDSNFLKFDSYNQRVQSGLSSAQQLKDIVNLQNLFFSNGKPRKGSMNIDGQTGEILKQF